jgi:hypothetical protein
MSIEQIKKLLDDQFNEYKYTNLSTEEATNIVFQDDVIERYLIESGLSDEEITDYIELNDLRDLQHDLIAKMSSCIWNYMFHKQFNRRN